MNKVPFFHLTTGRPNRATVISLIFLLLFSKVAPARANDPELDAVSWATMGAGTLPWLMFKSEPKPKEKPSLLSTAYISFHPTTHPIEHFEESEKFSVLRRSNKTEVICIDSNVPATVYVNKKKVGNTPFCGEIENGLTTKVVLTTEKYKPKKVPLEKHIHYDILLSSVYVSDPCSPHRSYSENPSTFVKTSANAASSSSPASNDMTMTSQGRWIEYSKNSYFVEFPVPQSETKKPSRKRTDASKWQVREFALKNFYDIKAGKDEYVKAMEKLSGLSEKEVEKIARKHSTPEFFAKEITRLSFE